MEELRISITDKIRKAFNCLIFSWRPHGHVASMVEATRRLRTLWMAVQAEKMIRNPIRITQHFQNKESCCDSVIHLAMCNWGLSEEHNSKSYEWIFFKFSENFHICLSKK